jgi:hypothetical protein
MFEKIYVEYLRASHTGGGAKSLLNRDNCVHFAASGYLQVVDIEVANKCFTYYSKYPDNANKIIMVII